MGRGLIIVLMIAALNQTCWAGEARELLAKDRKTRESYSLGYEFGENLQKQGLDSSIDVDVLLLAVRDALAAKKPVLSQEEINDTMQQLRKRAYVIKERRLHEVSVRNLEDGKSFLAANKTKEGVVTLPSGLQYRVLREGDGPLPKPSDTATVHYRGTLVNGTEFDSSYSREEASIVKVNGVIEGWKEALQLMKTGSKWQLFIPPELAYGKRKFGRIPPNSSLIFEIELLATGDSSGETASVYPVPAKSVPSPQIHINNQL